MDVVCNEKGEYEVIDEDGDVLQGGFADEDDAWAWMDDRSAREGA